MNWRFDNNIPIYIQVIDYIKQDIAKGVYNPGNKIPNPREFAIQAKVNPNAVQRAINQLIAEGILVYDSNYNYYVSNVVSANSQVRQVLIQRKVNEYISGMRELGVSDSEMADLVAANLSL